MKSIKTQGTNRLIRMFKEGKGTSKHQDKFINNGKPMPGKIYSVSTLENYTSVMCQFSAYAEDRFGSKYVKLDELRPLVPDYLQSRIDKGLSADTIHRDCAALSKVFRCQMGDWGVTLPKRERGNVTQHRDNSKLKGQFSESNNAVFIKLGQETGLRRSEMLSLRTSDVSIRPDGSINVFVRSGKGGKERNIRALGDTVLKMVEQAKQDGRDRVVEHIVNRLPEHSYRADYALAYYKSLARNPEELYSMRHDSSETYVCRKDMRGIILDRPAAMEVSENLGHNRVDVMPRYLYGLKGV